MDTKLSELFNFFWKFCKPYKFKLAQVMLFSLVWSLDLVVWPILLRYVIDTFTEFELMRSQIWPKLYFPIIFGLSFWLLVEIGFRVQGFVLAKTVPKIESSIRLFMFDHIQRHSPKYFQNNLCGMLVNKISDMTSLVSKLIEPLLTTFFPAFIGSIFAVTSLYLINPLFACIIGVWIIIHFLITFLSINRISKREEDHSHEKSQLMGKLLDSLINNFAVNLFFRFNYEYKRLKIIQEIEENKNVKAKMSLEWMRTFLGLFTFIFAGFLINAFMILSWVKGKISTGEAAQIFNTTWNVCFLIWMTSWQIPSYFQSIGLAKQALQPMKDLLDFNDKENAFDLQITKGEIVFDNVSFKYKKECLFKNKNVKIKPGEKLGLVGHSGAGKSTFVNLILRFQDLIEGAIYIDEQDISKVKLESLRDQISLIPQEHSLFHRSIKDNLIFANLNASSFEIEEALKKASLSHLIEKNHSTFSDNTLKQSHELSGGEKQRLTIARAILANKPILILDEATSALDSVTEHFIQKSFDDLMKGKTTLIIAHRLSTLKKMDRILVFDKGKIIEEGNHDELLNKNGLYKQMWDMQTGGFIYDK
jgi:ATP-binding cassette subfamily B protein